ncbi:MAG: TetR/AcrR family transcriptional regulator [Zymomonas mobilis]|uniref:TetR family transcriptional regulator n=1 Tax=Zymomonas mobilis TaxID=542 RepID=A0A542VZQ8_ZYMMB|nr:TetR/AcrR family transcriptional regulator [Zymomonas mobilis]TQL16798.1 TetR family transcriptional regulator [Zymomonas mobilis]
MSPEPSDSCSSKRHVGRPPQLDEKKRCALILKAAAIVLQNYGYDGSSMDRVAREAGMSKKTVYQMFPSKQILFTKLLEDRLFSIEWPTEEISEDPEEHLCGLLMAIARTILRPDRVCLFRILTVEHKSKEMRHIFNDILDGHTEDNLTRWFFDQKEKGNYAISDPVKYAYMVFNMTVGSMLLDRLFSLEEQPIEESSKEVREAVAIFLRGIRIAEKSE